MIEHVNWEFIESEKQNKEGETSKECAVNNYLPVSHIIKQSHCPVICLSELPAYLKSSRHWCCTDCGRTGRLAPWMTLWRNTWTTSPSKIPWGRRETRSWNMWQMASYFWTAGRSRSAPHQSPCVGWPVSSQVHTEDYTTSNSTELLWANCSCGMIEGFQISSDTLCSFDLKSAVHVQI